MENFEEYMLDVMNKAATALMLSVGHRTKLFDSMYDCTSMTSQQLAEKSNLNERYVREWLGAMVTGKIVDYEPSNKTYSLSEEKAKLLSRDGSYNFASSMQWIPALAYVEDEIVKCFEKGGGVPYESYHRFHAVMAEESSQTVLPALVHSILPLVPGLVEDLKEGIRVLDVGCGSGRALNLMAKNFPNSQFTGYDFSKEAIDYATSESEKLGNKNTSFQIQDVEHFPASEKFDLVTAFDAIHDQAAPAKVLQNIRGAVKEQGIFLMQDIGSSSQLENNKTHPLGPFLYTVSCLHCMTVSLALNGHGLGAMWGKEKATEMLNEAGFSKVDVKQLPHDPINYYYIAK
ncbi:MAG: class I SAM-dependent methyltransferase [Nitrosopumilaceae archaeon]|jgi:2-polyprenyl-3-methyl-5-hydroxy-6-metoxy-1,4-benzoquinol methylase|nr:class I SAM-dependent methyltransferase [Nitrosopumilaceae archaeon]NCF22043.1 methyltransferase domain-containing protein [Nitrosopumilaceae archaeon]